MFVNVYSLYHSGFFLVFICPPTCGFLIMMLYCLENPTLCIDNAVHVHKACLSFWVFGKKEKTGGGGRNVSLNLMLFLIKF